MQEAYDVPGVATVYEDRYIHEESCNTHVQAEMEVIQKLGSSLGYRSWCDFACGTAHHLRKTPGNFNRTGIDRSEAMIAAHREDADYSVEYIIDDILESTVKEYDLVTNFWYGYSHQATLKEVMQFFEQMQKAVKMHGSIVMTVHNPFWMFDKYPHASEAKLSGPFNFDAVHWSYTEPGFPDAVYHCIVPHKDKIVDYFSKYFKTVDILPYPEAEISAGKELLVCTHKI